MSITYEFQRSGDTDEYWIVSVPRRCFPGHKRSWPESITLGTVTIKERLVDTTFDVWHQFYYKGSAYLLDTAKSLIESSDMYAALMKARAEYHTEEQSNEEHNHTVKIGDEVTRWLTFHRASKYAQERLQQIWAYGLQVGRRAEFYRKGTDGLFVYHALEINEYGHVKVAGISALRGLQAQQPKGGYS